MDDSEDPALLMVCAEETRERVFLNEVSVIPSRFGSQGTKEEAEGIEWYLDNGASNHMTGNGSLFSSLNTNVVGKVKFGDGSSIEVEAERGCETRIKDEYLWLYDRLGKLILKVKRSLNRLYKAVLNAGTAMCFHTRLEGKHVRDPFPKETVYRAKQPLELVSMDLCGPITPETKSDIRLLTAPYSPQQNGAVERRNRTVMNMTRCILKEMDMPHVYKAEGVRHSVYILNRLPTKALKDATPYTLIKGKMPSLEYLRVFYCVGHVKIIGPDLKKLDTRNKPMIHLGFQEGTKGYRMLDVSKGKIVISRDVKFDEKRKWSWDKSDSTIIFEKVTESSESVFELADQIEENDNEAVDTSDSDNDTLEDQVAGESGEIPDLGGTSEVESSRRSCRVRNAPAHLKDYVLDKRVRLAGHAEEVDDQVNLLLAQEEEPSSYVEASKSKV
ncbi:hypothetical protein SSX86_007948 [Deinandra increscens subsp. villosa]|uniref:Integrase catalytic domain-containing protein n=1 Tax=Deinandra increscens subsp. villosa TaxID=3103831 RepID=A0AAP0DEU6_9ASTR